MPLALLLLLFLTACDGHYRSALRDYRAAEPTAFHRQTLEWTSKAVDDATPTVELEAALSRLAPATPSAEVFVDVAAAVLGREREGLASDIAAASAAIDAWLGGALQWRALAVAVAVHNPSVRAAGERWQASLRQYSQAEFLETLINQYRTFTRYLEVDAGSTLDKTMIQSYFPYPATIALKGEMIRQEVRMAELEWQEALREALMSAGRAFFEYQYLVRAERTTRENVRIVEDLLRVVEEQYRSGSGSQADFLRVQTELERQRNMLLDLSARRLAAVAELNGLLDRAPDARLGAPVDEDFALIVGQREELMQIALARRQEVGMAESKVARTAAAIRMGQVMNRPLAARGYSMLERGMMPEASFGESAMPYGIMEKVQDRPDYAQAEAYLSEMEARRVAQESALAAARSETRAMVLAWLAELDMARRQVALVSEVVLPQNRSTYETSLSAYTAGRISFIDLLDAERGWLAARLELDEARRDLNVTLLRYAEVTGGFAG
ncbi:TolC family protein [bacterium]|nr:TolC family protein [bacterium]